MHINRIDTNRTRAPFDTAVAAPLPADLTVNNEQEWTFRS